MVNKQFLELLNCAWLYADLAFQRKTLTVLGAWETNLEKHGSSRYRHKIMTSCMKKNESNKTENIPTITHTHWQIGNCIVSLNGTNACGWKWTRTTKLWTFRPCDLTLHTEIAAGREKKWFLKSTIKQDGKFVPPLPARKGDCVVLCYDTIRRATSYDLNLILYEV